MQVKAMTSRERVLAAIRHQTPDRTPMDFGGTAMSQCTPDFLQRMRQLLGYQLPPDRDVDGCWVDESIQRYLNVDLRLVPDAPPMAILRDLDPPAYQQRKQAHERRQHNAKTSDIKTTAISHAFPMAAMTCEEIQAMPASLPSPPVPLHLQWSIAVAKAYREAGYATSYWVSGGFFEGGCMNRGYDQFAMELLAEVDMVRALFDKWLPQRLHQVETTVRCLAPYIDIFCFGDDLALQSGPFMSPPTFRELIKPYMAEYYRHVHAAAPGSFLFHHCCGSVYSLVDDLIEIGVDVLNPIQPNAAEMEPERLKEKGRGRLCFHGGIDLQDLLPFGTPQQVQEETLRRKAILGQGGGYICAPAHSLPEDVPVENILAWAQAK